MPLANAHIDNSTPYIVSKVVQKTYTYVSSDLTDASLSTSAVCSPHAAYRDSTALRILFSGSSSLYYYYNRALLIFLNNFCKVKTCLGMVEFQRAFTTSCSL